MSVTPIKDNISAFSASPLNTLLENVIVVVVVVAVELFFFLLNLWVID